jgi:hypothetical protein
MKEKKKVHGLMLFRMNKTQQSPNYFLCGKVEIITAFVVEWPENFTNDLSNTLKGLQIIFSFSKFLLGSPQILSH